MKTEADFWACRVCRSINPMRSDRCYSCHTPREAAAARPTDIPVTGRLAPVEATGTYRSSETRAVLVSLAIVVYILGAFISLWLVFNAADLRAGGDRAAGNALIRAWTPFLVVAPLLGILALVAYGAWISRVVENLPIAGAGYSRVSPTFAFVEPLIPGFNLYSLPARLAEVTRKLEESGPGLPLIAIAWLLVVGPPLGALVISRVTQLFETSSGALRTLSLTLIGAFTFQAVALLIGLYLIWRVERLIRARAEGGTAPSGEGSRP